LEENLCSGVSTVTVYSRKRTSSSTGRKYVRTVAVQLDIKAFDTVPHQYILRVEQTGQYFYFSSEHELQECKKKH
jgi:hypothetical protein